MNDLNQIAELSPISDAEASQFVSDRTHAGLIAAITSAPSQSSASQRRKARRLTARTPMTRRWLVAAPIVLGIAGAVLIANLIGRPGARVGPINVGLPKAIAALTFTQHGHFIDVIVTNPYADQNKYDAEFKAHGLMIKLHLVAASPSLVDTTVYLGGTGNFSGIKVITEKGRCFTGGAGSNCPVGIRVPLNFRGTADFTFGRPAKPGEQYETAGSAFAPGEALHGLHIIGHQVGAVLALMKTRHVTVAVYHTLKHGNDEVTIGKAPSTWYVYDAIPWSKGKVLLEVGKTRHQPSAGPPTAGAPVPTPSPTGR
jgi:hypothetical protein